VNAKGKGNMTPLLWAYFDDRPQRLLLLLEHGADPIDRRAAKEPVYILS
jgi:hypothetical protein